MAIPYDPGKRLRKIAERRKRALTRYKRKPCDGTVQDYWRHKGRKEDACAASKKAWALHMRRRRRTGIIGPHNVPSSPLNDLEYRVKPLNPSE